jgi:hypothetical protein
MFLLMNTLSVLPPERVDLVEMTLRREGVSVPTLLKALDSKPGFVTLCGWVHGGEPISAQFPTGMVVCSCQDEEFERLLHEFSVDLKKAQARAPKNDNSAEVFGHARA